VTPDDVIGAFMYGQNQLQVNDAGLKADNDPEDLQTMGALSVAVYRLTADSDTPVQAALARLAVVTGGLLVSKDLGQGDTIVRKWLTARSEVLDLQLAANN
jgi:hypothetical protein